MCVAPDSWAGCISISQDDLMLCVRLCFAVIQSLIALVNDPQPEHPLRADLAEEYSKDRKKFLKNAEEFTKKHGEKRPMDWAPDEITYNPPISLAQSNVNVSVPSPAHPPHTHTPSSRSPLPPHSHSCSLQGGRWRAASFCIQDSLRTRQLSPPPPLPPQPPESPSSPSLMLKMKCSGTVHMKS